MPVPVMYAALDPAGALFETIFHDVPERGPRSVQLARLQSRVLTRLDIHSAAILADLTKPGLATLGTTRAELIDSDGSHYSTTALWSAALYNDNPGLAGLWWISRPNDRFDSLMFFDGRIDASSFGAAPRSMPLWEGEGLDLVAKWAGQADITLI